MFRFVRAAAVAAAIVSSSLLSSTCLVVPAHAVNHRMTIAYANYAGVEGDITYCGGSTIVAPDAAILAYAGPGPALLTADIARQPDPALIQHQVADYRAPKVS